ncbi:MAG TPA: hypothetical protein VM791_06280 [Vicinamibacterales bacterium]|nr:hypothetical protein [Vicinamibacterales bacterium]
MRALVFVTAVLCAVPAAAQEIGKATVTTNAPIYIQPGAQVPLRVAKVGTALKVLQEEGEWLEVEFNDPQFGRRVGWVQKKLVQIVRPELQPLDLSVRDTPAQPARTEQQPVAVQPPLSATTGLHPQVREGFWFSAGLGYGTFGCEECLGREDGLSGGISLGGGVSDRVLLGVGTTGYAKSVAGETFSVGTLDARIRFYPARTSGFFINGGIGLGSMSFAGESEFGVGLMLGLGWDIRVGRNVSLTPFWNGFAMSNSNVDGNVGQIGLGFTVH